MNYPINYSTQLELEKIKEFLVNSLGFKVGKIVKKSKHTDLYYTRCLKEEVRIDKKTEMPIIKFSNLLTIEDGSFVINKSKNELLNTILKDIVKNFKVFEGLVYYVNDNGKLIKQSTLVNFKVDVELTVSLRKDSYEIIIVNAKLLKENLSNFSIKMFTRETEIGREYQHHYRLMYSVNDLTKPHMGESLISIKEDIKEEWSDLIDIENPDVQYMKTVTEMLLL